MAGLPSQGLLHLRTYFLPSSLSRSTSYVGFHGWNVARKESSYYVWLQDVINNSDHQAVLRLSNLVEGIYKFKLTVADGKGLKGNDDVILTVKEGALPNQFVNAWWLTFYSATSVCIFSILFLMHFQGCWQRGFVSNLTIRSSPSWSFPFFLWP